ncbi:MAG: beta-propeller fold lactonase family protein [Planctomycetes bacterium]|nr:beta-propeller fold lactonase family protein [Planctomycetota bacterium]
MNIRSVLLGLSLSTAVAAQGGFGAVYSLTNDAIGNAVAVSIRLPSGHLVPFASFATGGEGTGAGLGSQAALASSADGRYLFAVDAGSDELTMFRVFGGAFFWRVDTVASGGDRPTSVAAHHRLVYVLNADSDQVDGFRRVGNQLQAIPGASYALSQAGAAAAQVGFTPDGAHLVVTERATNQIVTFPVHADGTLGAATVNGSAGQTPFGFGFAGDTLVVSEAAGGAMGASTVSTYRVQADGSLQVLTAALPTGQSAACWIAVPRHGGDAYTTNTGSGNLTGLDLDGGGTATLLDASGVSGDLGAMAHPIDADFTPNGRILYVLDSGNDVIRALRRKHDGSLQLLSTSVALPDGAAGLLVR